MLCSNDAPLFDLEFFVAGKLEKSKREITQVVEEMKGRVGAFIHSKTAAVISDAQNVKAKSHCMMPQAEKLGIQVVPVGFLDAVKTSNPFSLINDMNISSWKCIDVSCSNLNFRYTKSKMKKKMFCPFF